MMKSIEILAPAGSYESLVAAINASCDAVYIGGTKFGARAYANNLEEETLLKAIDYTHIHDKKIYLTINTLLKNSELEDELYQYVSKFYEQGLDAVIVQDLGVLNFIHEQFPGIPIHASTQMSITMAQGGNVLKEMGVTRLVNARELSLNEIKAIRDGTDMEIESFVHGALCYCYSGQCLMSSMLGGRSGNRGRCAQPCRMAYEVTEGDNQLFSSEERYPLSPKDISTLEIIPELIEAGIDSFKIEGRMKRPEYTAGVTYIYRKYSDKYLECGKENYRTYIRNHAGEIKQDIRNLQDLYNRGGFSKGYYHIKNGREMMALGRPNHTGLCIGKITECRGNQAKMQLLEDIHAQDILEVRNRSVNLYEFTVKTGEKKGRTYSFNIGKGIKVKTGDLVYRTKNNELLNQLFSDYLKEEKKVLLKGTLYAYVGEPLRLELHLNDLSVLVQGDTVQEAVSQPMEEDKLRKQIQKTNESSYQFETLEIERRGNVFIPVQKLNELRREGLEALTKTVTEQFRRSRKNIVRTGINTLITNLENTSNPLNIHNQEKKIFSDETLGINTAVSHQEQIMPLCKIEKVTAIYLKSDGFPLEQLREHASYIKERGKRCYIILPHIFRKATYDYFLQYKSILEDDTIDGYIIKNLEEYAFLVNELDVVNKGKEIITDYNLYVFNQQAADFWKKYAITKYTAPLELNFTELKELSGIYQDMIVYGYLPVMVSAQCIYKTSVNVEKANEKTVRGNPCLSNNCNKAEVIDRYGKKFRVIRNCRECYNTIYNSQCLSLLKNASEVKLINPGNIRLDFNWESPAEVKEIMDRFVKAYCYGEKDVKEIDNFTRGHFKRGVE